MTALLMNAFLLVMAVPISCLKSQEASEEQIMNFVNTYGNQSDDENCFCNVKTKICTCHLLASDGTPGVYEMDAVTAARIVEELYRVSGTRLFGYLPATFAYEDKRLGTLTRDNPVVDSTGSYPQQASKIGIKFVLFYQDFGKEKNVILELTDDGRQKLPTKCDSILAFIHGFRNNIEEEKFVILRKGILKYASSRNMVCALLIDWSAGAAITISSLLHFDVYGEPAVNTITVGRATAVLLKQLSDSRQIRLDRVHLIGFSLGAQICHSAAAWLKKITQSAQRSRNKSQVRRITGLDPAARHFEGLEDAFLTAGDAAFVDIIHTSVVKGKGDIIDTASGRFGIEEAIGNVDFYPNGGTAPSPRCKVTQITCSHESSVIYFTQSLDANTSEESLISLPCASFESFPRCEKKKEQLEAECRFNIMGIAADPGMDGGKLYNRFDSRKKEAAAGSTQVTNASGSDFPPFPFLPMSPSFGHA